MVNDIENKIEALLFLSLEPINIKKIANVLNITDKSLIKQSLEDLNVKYKDGALKIINIDNQYELVVKSNYNYIKKIQINGLKKRKLTPPLAEVLSIIVYKGPINKYEIEDLRGVNSQQALRNLEIMGLIKKDYFDNNEKYIVSYDLLKKVGVESIKELRKKLDEDK